MATHAGDEKLKPKLLCVDDEAGILAAVERVLKAQFEVLTSTSPVDALRLLAANPDVAVILSDYRMPEMTGLEFLRATRRTHPEAARAILSGQIDLQNVSEALNNGDIHKFLLKPWENDYLQLQMSAALNYHHTLSAKAHFEKLSITDPVTQVSNHRHFQDQLRQGLREAEAQGHNLSLLVIDVDHFKAFNDRFGHPEGDRLLHAIAKHLERIVGRAGLVSRYGGEEFTVILPHISRDEALAFAEQIRHHFENTPFTGLSASPAYVTVSTGMASFPVNAVTAPELVDAADRALYQAKRQGRNQVAIAPLGAVKLRR